MSLGKDIVLLSGRVPFTKHRSWEVQLTWWTAKSGLNDPMLFRFCTEWTRCCDHAGPCIEFDLWRLFFCAQIYDNRHWDYKNRCWEEHHDTSQP